MPGLDGTGPQGKGPLTGRRRGKCVDKSESTGTQASNSPENERSFGLGRGQFGGRRRRRRMRGRGD